MINICIRKFLSICIILSILFLNGCGTIFYPERRGNSAHLDAGVAILDGIGVLFFILPGVIAYAVDFTTGCIYLSGGGHGKSHAEIVPLDPTHNVEEQINNALYAHYGVNTDNAIAVDDIMGVTNWYQFQALNTAL